MSLEFPHIQFFPCSFPFPFFHMNAILIQRFQLLYVPSVWFRMFLGAPVPTEIRLQTTAERLQSRLKDQDKWSEF